MAEDDQENPGGPVVYEYLVSSGRRYDDCVIFGRRYPENVGPVSEDSDYWILVNQPDTQQGVLTYSRWSWKSMLTGLWKSPSGKVFVSDATLGGVHIFEDVMDQARSPIDFKLPNDVAPEGVWGLSDDCVFTWGTRMDAHRKKTYPVFRFDGRQWHELPSLRSPISKLHGTQPDVVYAAGWQGLISRWDGTRWTEFPTPTREILTDVHVEDWDEMYAVGTQGIFLEGSASGWGFGANNPLGAVPLRAVAKYKGEVYVGAGTLGLLKRATGGGALEEFKAHVGTNHLEARDNLIVCGNNAIIGTSDNSSFFACAVDKFEETTQNIPIMPL